MAKTPEQHWEVMDPSGPAELTLAGPGEHAHPGDRVEIRTDASRGATEGQRRTHLVGAMEPITRITGASKQVSQASNGFFSVRATRTPVS